MPRSLRHSPLCLPLLTLITEMLYVADWIMKIFHGMIILLLAFKYKIFSDELQYNRLLMLNAKITLTLALWCLSVLHTKDQG